MHEMAPVRCACSALALWDRCQAHGVRRPRSTSGMVEKREKMNALLLPIAVLAYAIAYGPVAR